MASRFSKAYPVVLLARTPATYESSVKAINDAGGKAIGVVADAGDRLGGGAVLGIDAPTSAVNGGERVCFHFSQ